MLDKATQNVLSIINDGCKDNNFIIIKDSDIVPKLNKKNKLSDDGVKDAVNYLAEREYVKLKYAEDGTYCLAMLPKGRLFDENTNEDNYKVREEDKRNYKFLMQIAFISALFSFLGAAAAVLILKNFIG
ncbi:MAG: hypothetical protein AB7S44_02265 [Spirochaetales bacterium]